MSFRCQMKSRQLTLVLVIKSALRSMRRAPQTKRSIESVFPVKKALLQPVFGKWFVGSIGHVLIN
ncbi:hypothetical protein U0070_025697 [Myodes glareolus]|uniref:Uncharacterized protein n=1 Tax=Myodes glareolus TaxID=447135 RepID=A0AAW0HNA9_MYOGA